MSFWRRIFGTTTPEELAPKENVIKSRRRVPSREAEAAPPPAKRRKVRRIREGVLRMVMEVAKDAYPSEFGGTLRAEGDTVTELILVPAAVGSERSALLPLFNLPYDPSIVGTVHSHPSPHPFPSDADLQLFRNFGHTHVIVAHPYSLDMWRAYDHDGDDVELEVVP